MAYFPMFVDLEDQLCLVIGGGSVALGKAKVLLSYDAKVMVVAEACCDELKNLSTDAKVVLKEKSFEETDLEGIQLVVAATDDHAFNARVSVLCRNQHIPVNVVDQKELCTFTFPAIHRQDDLVVAVSTSGKSPTMAAYLKNRIAETLPSSYGTINDRMGQARAYIRQSVCAEDRKKACHELLSCLMGEKILRIGTRTSRLALIQTDLFLKRLHESFPEIQTEIVPMRTMGDRLKDRPVREIGGKGIWSAAFEDAMRDGTIDCAVHSAKDMSSTLPADMRIACVLARDAPGDVLVMRKDAPELYPDNMEGVCIGTGSSRRKAAVKAIYPECTVRDIRGNLPTRIEKLRSGDYDALVLAEAGLKRLHLEDETDLCFKALPVDTMVPAAGQGTIAVETMKEKLQWLGCLSDQTSLDMLDAERRILRMIHADCRTPVGVYARQDASSKEVRIDLWKADEKKGRLYHQSQSCVYEQRTALAERMAEELMTWEESY